jgi:4-aminobutyrate---pyruvate transaminase
MTIAQFLPPPIGRQIQGACVSNRKPNSAQARDVMFHLHSQTNPQRHAEIGPLIMTRGSGVHVFDSNGKRYLEAMAGLW